MSRISLARRIAVLVSLKHGSPYSSFSEGAFFCGFAGFYVRLVECVGQALAVATSFTLIGCLPAVHTEDIA